MPLLAQAVPSKDGSFRVVAPGVPTRMPRTNSTSVPRLARWILPNLCSAVFAVTLLQVLVVSGGGHALFRDSDTGWHIRSGEAMLSSRTIPVGDSFSFTREGRPWFAWEWLSDITFGAIDRAAGLPGVALFSAFLIALAIAGSTAFALRLGANFFAAAASVVLLLGVTSLHWLARPHLFSWVLGLSFVVIAEQKRRLWILPVLSALWANLHGSFLLGVAILAAYAIGRWSIEYGAATLASLAATFVNPYGRHLHEHVIAYLRDDYLMTHIAEFRSFDFHSPGAIFVEVFLVAAVAAGLLAAQRRNWTVVLLSAGLLYLAFGSARHVPLAALILLPFVAAQLSLTSAVKEYANRLRAFDRQIVGAVPAMFAVVLAATVVSATPTGFDAKSFPVSAASYFEGRTTNTRVFARDQWGGYLIYRFNGSLKVFIDGRSDFYGQDFLERYATLAEVRPGWEKILDAERITHVLIPPDQALAQALRAREGWKIVRADAVAMIFERALAPRSRR